MKLRTLIGNGDKIMLLSLPFVVVGLILNIKYPSNFSVGRPNIILLSFSVLLLLIGVINWVWCIFLIITKIPKKELIQNGPYKLIKHPLYIGFAFLILPWVGFLFNSWLGAILGLIMYAGTWIFGKGEEEELEKRFGSQWSEYKSKVIIKWI